MRRLMSCKDTWHMWWLRTLHARRGNLGGPLLVTVKTALFFFLLTLGNVYNTEMPSLRNSSCVQLHNRKQLSEAIPVYSSSGPSLDSCTGCAVCFENMLASWRDVSESMDWTKFRVHGEIHASLTVRLSQQTLARIWILHSRKTSRVCRSFKGRCRIYSSNVNVQSLTVEEKNIKL